ncbi:autotransporter domain-containing protein [Nordella sp. HKS 07]|uniref:autotransporter domain-containing protein n=1 Tax=Nordella sp. HKS 07 TaxID=2712222 RepID=UPI0013E0F5BD|nr:autotransporter domain-containing protein [Nordella sp. HKS 07]QIG47330.1 autotransporter domain-containing protein [Nordella sp. HKS 07]
MALTTVLTVAPFMGYGRQAEAACVPDPVAPTYTCSGASGAQTITSNDAAVTTVAGFGVTTAAGNGITITGDGAMSFIDRTASVITSTNGHGLYVGATGNNTDDGAVTIETNGAITGSAAGIYARTDGQGDIDITADGTVTGESGAGIHAYSNMGDDMTITTGIGSAVTGADGILADSEAMGNLDITANGRVTGLAGDGIRAVSNLGMGTGLDLTITTGTQSSVFGRENGINANNFGKGDLIVTARGIVTGEERAGVYAYNSENGANLTVATESTSVISGDDNGINARNYGGGDLTVIADGQVTAYSGDGIRAYNLGGVKVYGGGDYDFKNGAGQDLTITTGAGSVVTGERSGITAFNGGAGDLSITVNGLVTGNDGDGIRAYNFNGDSGYIPPVQRRYYGAAQNMTISTGAASVITGRDDGIDVGNTGAGILAITVRGTVTGQGDDGIGAYNFNYGDDLKIVTDAGSLVTGIGGDGIDANHYGAGDLDITVDGRVTGRGEEDLFGSGIEAENDGGGDTLIKIGGTGLVEGDFAAIETVSDGEQTIAITNDGVVRNLSAESDDQAIYTGGAETDVLNRGTLIGYVDLDDHDDTVENAGLWNMANGTSKFYDGDDEVTNSGTLLAADDKAMDEETVLEGLERFGNSGLVSLVDGRAGDILRLIGEGPGEVDYSATDARLAVDAVLGAGSDGLSDVLFIGGNVSGGTTRISVNVVDVLGANMLGIPVVDVIDCETGEGDFVLQDGPIQAGFFSWDLRYNALENWHELYSSGIGIGAYEFAAGITGAQDIWHQTTGTLAQRQADLRPLLNGTQVTPVADFAEPVAPAGVGRVGPGFWFNAVGGWLDRDAEQDGYTLDRKQSIYGGLAGFDVATDAAGGETWLFGIFGGYLGSTLKFSETNTKWTYDGPTVGAYATYLNDAFYADVTVKADFLSISIDPEDLAAAADDSDTDGVNLGGRVDTGYKIGGTEGVFFEPQATLAVVNSDIDDTEIYGGDVDFDSETSVKGRLGLRLGYDQTAGNAVVYSSDVTASVWQEFNGSNDASIAVTGLDDFGVADDTIATLGDISLGFAVTAPEGWSGFLRANYQFAEDFEAITGNAGVRYAW